MTDVPVLQPGTINLEPYRQPNGRMNWAEVRNAGVLRTFGGVTQFGVALFLKELALVATSGDVQRMEEFFEFLTSTDFITHYGLFTLGSSVGNVANLKHLRGHFKPGSMARLLNTQLALAAGLGLTMVGTGNWDGKVFTINLASIGLSMSAVRGAAGSLSWVHGLTSRKGQALLTRIGLTRAARLSGGGMIYSIGETAAVLLLAEPLAAAIGEHLDVREARREVGEASEAFRLAVSSPVASAESIQEATAEFQEAWNAYRRFLYRDALAEEARFAQKITALARDAKLADDRRRQSMERYQNMPSLTANVIERYGSLEEYARRMTQEANDAVDAKFEALAREFGERREKRLREIYEAKRRGRPLLGKVKDPVALFEAYAEDTGARRKDERRYRKSVSLPSLNRLQTFDDEAEILRAAASALRRREAEGAAIVVDRARVSSGRAGEADAQLRGSLNEGAVGRLGGL